MPDLNPTSVATQIPAHVAIGMGSNLGESLQTLDQSLQAFDRSPGIRLITHSRWYTTKPVGGPQQPDYTNGCALLRVDRSPEELLLDLLRIEQDFKRVRQERWGPRTLDLDLLLYDDRILDTPNLQIPHPRMRERAFVLVPLAEIAPNWIDPVSQKTISQLLDSLDPVEKSEVKPC